MNKFNIHLKYQVILIILLSFLAMGQLSFAAGATSSGSLTTTDIRTHANVYFQKGIKAYKKAIKINPRLAEAHEYLGEVYAELGKIDLAENELLILKSLESDEAVRINITADLKLIDFKNFFNRT